VTDNPGGSAAARVTQYYYDWRDRQVASKQGVQSSEDTTTHRPIIYNDLDNLGEVTAVSHYDGDGVTITFTNGVPNKPSASLLREYSTTQYDEQQRPYATHTFSVDQSAGTISTYSLNTNSWYDHRGDVIEESDPGGLVTKTQFDGAGREIERYTTDGASGTSWANASSVASDNVLNQVDTQYDADGNVILTINRDRFHNETTLGALGNPTTAPLARVSYVADYYDAANRLTATVDVGTNGGTAYTRPASPPTPSATVLVTSTAYNAAGWVATLTDPRGIVTQISYDNLGRTIKTIDDYTNGTPTANSNQTAEYTYDGDGNTLTVKVDLPGGAYQTTQYVYGVTTAGGSNINSNDMLAAIYYPNTSTGNPDSSHPEAYTVNALGQRLTMADRNANGHSYTYDVLGRLTADAVPTLGSGVDGSVRRLTIAYDTGDRPYLFTSYNAATGGSIVNQVQDVYNGLSQLITEYQATSGAVNTGTSPKTQYSYNLMAGGANNSRLTSMTYPNGRVLNYNYNTGLDSNISRLSSISDTSATLVSYSYLGLSTVVIESYPQPGVELTYVKLSGESNGDAGDQYTGLDRFGRVVDQRWIVTSTGAATDRFQYGYDQDSNVLYRNNLVNTSFGELYHANGSSNGYDNLNRLTNFARGVLSASGSTLDTINSPSETESWSLDAVGNWPSVTLNGTAQTRTANQQNEITSISGLTTPGYDLNGNTTTDQAGKTLVYDAWNRLVAYKSGSTTLVAWTYDALGRQATVNFGTLTSLYYNSSWQVVEEQQSGSMVQQYVWNPLGVDSMVERDTTTQRLYVEHDANGDVTSVIDTSGNVQERYIYDPYGAVTVLTPTWTVRSGGSSFGWVYLFQGGRYDSTSTLIDFRNRYDSPALGRWMQVDPAGFLGSGGNLYDFVYNAPIDATDPTGLDGGRGSLLGNFISDTRKQITNTINVFTGGGIEDIPLRNPPVPPYESLPSPSDISAGAADAISGNLTKRLRQSAAYDDGVNYDSGSYRVGNAAGQVLGIVVSMYNPCAVGGLAGTGLRGLGAIGGLGSLLNARDAFSSGNYVEGSLEGLGALGGLFRFLGPCFAAGTPLLTPTGDKPIEQFKPGDWILTAPEDDPTAPLEAKQVEEIFVNRLTLWHLHVGGRVLRTTRETLLWVEGEGQVAAEDVEIDELVRTEDGQLLPMREATDNEGTLQIHLGGQMIQTTAEHPFWVQGKGWTAAKELQQGDLLRSHDGKLVPLQETFHYAREATVYNVRIADYHTYFVGSREWGFSVWAHNECSGLHHFVPKFMGSLVPNGSKLLTFLNAADHTGIHAALRAFLKPLGMMPSSVNSGARIQVMFSKGERIGALVKFYKQYKNGAYFPQFVSELVQTLQQGKLVP